MSNRALLVAASRERKQWAKMQVYERRRAYNEKMLQDAMVAKLQKVALVIVAVALGVVVWNLW